MSSVNPRSSLSKGIGLALAAAAVGLTAFLLWKAAGPRPGAAEEASAVKGVAQVTVAVAGARQMQESIELLGVTEPEPNAATIVSAQVTARIRRLAVREGDSVRAGQVVAELDPGENPAQLAQATLAVGQEQLRATTGQEQATAGVLSAQAQVRKAERELLALRAGQTADLTRARATLATAQREFEQIQAGSRPQEIAVARAAVDEADANRQSALKQERRMKRLYDEQVASQRQWEEAQTQAQTVQAQYQAALERLRLAEAGPRKEELAVAEARVHEAQSGLRVVEAGQLTQAGKREELAAARAQLASAQAAQRQAQAGGQEVRQKTLLLEQTRVRGQYLRVTAPISGIVARRAANEGDTAQMGAVLLEIVQPGRLRFRVGVPETRLRRLRSGLAARIRFDSLSDTEYAARIQSIGAAADSSGNGNLWLTLSGPPPQELRPGLSGKAMVTVQAKRAAVVVPASALIREESADLVVVVDGENTAHRKKVTLGLRNGDWVQIVSGIRAGEKVVTVGNYEVEDGGKVEIEPDAPEKKP